MSLQCSCDGRGPVPHVVVDTTATPPPSGIIMVLLFIILALCIIIILGIVWMLMDKGFSWYEKMSHKDMFSREIERNGHQFGHHQGTSKSNKKKSKKKSKKKTQSKGVLSNSPSNDTETVQDNVASNASSSRAETGNETRNEPRNETGLVCNRDKEKRIVEKEKKNTASNAQGERMASDVIEAGIRPIVDIEAGGINEGEESGVRMISHETREAVVEDNSTKEGKIPVHTLHPTSSENNAGHGGNETKMANPSHNPEGEQIVFSEASGSGEATGDGEKRLSKSARQRRRKRELLRQSRASAANAN